MSKKKVADAVIEFSDLPILVVPAEEASTALGSEEDLIDVKYSEAKQGYLLKVQESIANGEMRKTTFVTYQSALNRFGKWLDTNGYAEANIIEVLTAVAIQSFLGSLLREHKNCGTTRRNMYGIINGFCRHLRAARILTTDPMEHVVKPKKSAPKESVPTDEQVAAVMIAAERQYKKPDAAMSVALLATMVHAGLRASEVVKMRVADVDFSQHVLYVPDGKGGKSDKVHPVPAFFAAIRRWLPFREQMNCRHDLMWAHDSNRSISDEWLRSHLRDLQSRAGLDEDAAILPHSIRRWMATDIARKIGPFTVQRTLRHSHISTTYLYLKANDEDGKKLATHAAFDPHAVVAPRDAALSASKAEPSITSATVAPAVDTLARREGATTQSRQARRVRRHSFK